MEEEELITAVVAGLLVGIPLVWMGILFLLSRLGGWSALAVQYPIGDRLPRGNTFHWCSASFSLLGYYRNCLTISITTTGIRLRMPILLRTGHNPIFIPWHAVLELDGSNSWLSAQTQLKIRNKHGGNPATITLYGEELVESLAQKFKRN